MVNKITKIFQSPYQLKFKTKHREPLKGSLLCFEFDCSIRGYSDFLVWPQWDKASLTQQLEDVIQQKESPRFLIAKKNAWLDAQARFKKQNLLYGLKIPDSHFLIEDILSFDRQDILLRWNYQYIKIKIQSTNINKQIERLKSLSGMLPKKIKWRLDFNFKESKPCLQKQNLDFLWNQIDFIEDPGPHFKYQNRASVRFADDWKTNPFCRTKIAKPSRDYLGKLNSSLARAQFQRVIFTHSFDHPLGQATSAFWAAQFYKIHPAFFETSGLKCLNLKEDEFSFHQDLGPKFQTPHGFGFGFDEALKARQWERLV